MKTRIALVLGLCAVSTACNLPGAGGSAGSSSGAAGGSPAGGAPKSGGTVSGAGGSLPSGAKSLVAVMPTAGKVTANLGTTQALAIKLTSMNGFKGKVQLSADVKNLRVADPGKRVAITFDPAVVDLASGAGTSLATINVGTASPALSSAFNILATPTSDATGVGSSAVAITVNALYEVFLADGDPKQAVDLWSMAANSSVDFATHPSGLTVRFLNRDTRLAVDTGGKTLRSHRVHSAGLIPHQGPDMIKADKAGGDGSDYVVKVTSTTPATVSFYCHNHSAGKDAMKLNFNTTSAPSPLTPTTNPNATYTYISRNIIAPKCQSCHASTSGGGYTFKDYANVLSAVAVGDSRNSPLYQSVIDPDAKTRMPLGGAALSATDVQAIADWIGAGAKDN